MAKIETPIPSLKLNDGNSMPMLAYGTGTSWTKTGDESKIDRALVDSVKKAIEMGYTHLDCAEFYKTEAEVGIAIKESKIAREKLYVTTKVYHGVEDIAGAIRGSLKKLQLDYVDQYLIHAPFNLSSDTAMQEAWKAMEKVKQEGLAKSIGVSNFLPQHLDTLASIATIPPAANQIEFNPYLQRAKLIQYHKDHHIATTAYAPLIPITKAAPGPVDGLLASLSKKYAVHEPEILLRWCIDQDIMPVTTTGKEQRLSDYLRAATFKLTPKEIEEIGKLGEQKRYRGFWLGRFEKDDWT